MVGEKDRVTGGLGQLLYAGGDIDGVTNQGELELAGAADGARDHHTGVDPDADSKLPAKPLGDQAMNPLSSGGIGVHIGARVSALAGANDVLVSSTLRDLVIGSGLQFEDRGTYELKGVPGQWQLFAVACG